MKFALFAKVNDEWRFEGFAAHEEVADEFAEAVTEDNGPNTAKVFDLDGKD